MAWIFFVEAKTGGAKKFGKNQKIWKKFEKYGKIKENWKKIRKNNFEISEKLQKILKFLRNYKKF